MERTEARLDAETARALDHFLRTGPSAESLQLGRRVPRALFVRALERDHAPLHEIRVQGGVVLRVHRLAKGPEADAWHETWEAEIRARGALRRVMAFLRRTPEVAQTPIAAAAAEEAVPLLARALGDEDRYVRGNAVQALRRVGTPSAVEVLLESLTAARWCPFTTRDTPY